MFESLELLPPDPILGVSLAFAADPNPQKVNLGVGIYRDDQGKSPIFDAVKVAERQLLAEQETKAYVAQAGDPAFLDQLTTLIVGETLVASHGNRITAATTIGGSGALRLAAELTLRAKPTAKAWVSKPTWGNHFPLLKGAGMEVVEYDYYDFDTGAVNFEKMIVSLADASAGDLVVLHACCHNPTGADLSNAQWEQVIDLAEKVGFVPLLDIAYQGFGQSLSDDSFAVQLAVAQLPEVLVASSCSKNFGLYRERSGLLLIVGKTEKEAEAARSHVLAMARTIYSMPGYHGPAIVGQLLRDKTLRAEWSAELEQARTRVANLRARLAVGLNGAQKSRDFSFLAKQKGMFSLLGLDQVQVQQLRDIHSVHLIGTSRVNIAGLSDENLERVVTAVGAVVRQ